MLRQSILGRFGTFGKQQERGSLWSLYDEPPRRDRIFAILQSRRVYKHCGNPYLASAPLSHRQHVARGQGYYPQAGAAAIDQHRSILDLD